jgi:deoxycytidylate deaminase
MMGVLAEPLPRSSTSNYLRWAAAYAAQSDLYMHKMGAVIVRNGNLYAGGWNKKRSHPQSKSYMHFIHAELAAIINSANQIGTLTGSNADMYVMRITRGGAMATSKPCKECWVLLKEAGLRSVTFIDVAGKIIQERL